MSEETPSVWMKGMGNSLWVTIAPDISIEAAHPELEKLFDPLKHMAGTVRVVLNTGGSPKDDRYRQFSAYLKDTFSLKEVISPEENARQEESRVKTKPVTASPAQPILSRQRGSGQGGDTVVMAGRIRSGQHVSAKKHLIIMGDVNPGCELVAGGDILVLGSLQGAAAAGQSDTGNTDAIILSLDFRPTQVKIGNIVAAGLPTRSQGRFEFAHVEGGVIVVDDYVGANPFKRMPWPAIR
ncbi:septum site-determining protein MinC [Desulfosarcina sp. OttesenSCG-928-B08]|nr:septum site-determining protein MinC [Desulfosarcina sp. OttesenSCG-928-B08]